MLSIHLTLPATLGPGITQPVAEMNTRRIKIMFLRSRALPVREADNLTPICEAIL
jgi:hypothetical protein